MTTPQFKEWQARNAERIAKFEARGTTPHFLRDNGAFVEHHNHGNDWEKTAFTETPKAT